MNLIQTATKDCPREDCSVTVSATTSTCMSWTPTYNKAGERIDSGDPNYGTQQLRCGACGEMWLATTKDGKTDLRKLTTTSQ